VGSGIAHISGLVQCCQHRPGRPCLVILAYMFTYIYIVLTLTDPCNSGQTERLIVNELRAALLGQHFITQTDIRCRSSYTTCVSSIIYIYTHTFKKKYSPKVAKPPCHACLIHDLAVRTSRANHHACRASNRDHRPTVPGQCLRVEDRFGTGT
jgi:hypothetical protein